MATNNINIPNGWSINKLGSFMTFKNGLNAEKESYGFGIKFVNTMDIFNNKRLYENNIIGSINVSDKKINENDVIFGDVLFNRTSEIPEEIAFSSVYLDNKKITFGGFIIRGRAKKDIIDPQYSVYCFQSCSFRKDAIRRCQGVIRSNIGQNDLSQISILLPPLSEQEKIAEILSCWDEAIEKLSGLIEQKKLLKKGLMQKLLTGKTRLSGFTQPWKTVKLGEIGKTYTGLSGKNSSDFGSGFPFITYMNIYLNNQIKNDQFEFVNIKENENQNAVKYGDIFFTTSSETPDEVGFASVLLFNPEVNTYLNSFCFGFRLNDFETLLPEFASFYFRSEDVRKIMLKLAQGATRFNLSKNELMKEKITIPSDITEQKAIADVLQSCDLESEKLKTKLDLLKLQKKGLMQQLLTGKIRVKVDK